MKSQSLSLLLASGFTIGMLSSCVTPYDSYHGASVTTTSYHQPGYRINTLPSGYRSEVISGSNYYYHNGAYYRRDSSGYVVVNAPRTSRYYTDYNRHRGQRHDSVRTLNRLPSGYQTVNHGGTQYYTVGDTFYQRQGRGYTVVSRPSVTRLPSGYRTVNHGGKRYYKTGDTYYQRQGSAYILVSRPY